jgi:hypothetical protein
MAEIPVEEWAKEVQEARAALRRRFPELRCVRCGRDNFLFRLWPDETLVPGLASETDNRVVELICRNCGFQEKHVVRLLAAAPSSSRGWASLPIFRKGGPGDGTPSGPEGPMLFALNVLRR